MVYRSRGRLMGTFGQGGFGKRGYKPQIYYIEYRWLEKSNQLCF